MARPRGGVPGTTSVRGRGVNRGGLACQASSSLLEGRAVQKQAVVLAGGLATRMRPQTLRVPKSMLEVAGRPFVDWQLERLAACGFDVVVMCVAHLAEQIEAHVGDGARYGVRVRWAREGAK